MAKKKAKTFEENMARIEEIVRLLEQGDSPLEESLKLFEEGAALIRCCTASLDDAQIRVTQVMAGPEGEPIEGKFEYDD